jgi:hypothetical protein
VLIRRNVISILVAIVSSAGSTGVEKRLQIALAIVCHLIKQLTSDSSILNEPRETSDPRAMNDE